MSDTYSVSDSSSSGWLSKRYLGVPVVYLAGGLVAILVMVAYLGSRKKNTTGAPAVGTQNTTPVDPYSGLASNGTVTTAAPVYYVSPNTQNVPTQTIQTMAAWEAGAVSYLVGQGVNGTDAQSAITAYANGQDMTYAQKALVDKAIAGYGMPPQITSIGHTTPNYADINTYVSFRRDATPPYAIYGILPDGTEHHMTPSEWLLIGHPDNRIALNS